MTDWCFETFYASQHFPIYLGCWTLTHVFSTSLKPHNQMSWLGKSGTRWPGDFTGEVRCISSAKCYMVSGEHPLWECPGFWDGDRVGQNWEVDHGKPWTGCVTSWSSCLWRSRRKPDMNYMKQQDLQSKPCLAHGLYMFEPLLFWSHRAEKSCVCSRISLCPVQCCLFGGIIVITKNTNILIYILI